MTVSEAIERSAVLCPAELHGDKPYIFLSEIESRIRCELLGQDAVIFTELDGGSLLCAEGAYAQIYPLYIVARCELAAGDADRYSFYNSVFEQMYSDYANSVNRARAVCGGVRYIKTV